MPSVDALSTTTTASGTSSAPERRSTRSSSAARFQVTTTATTASTRDGARSAHPRGPTARRCAGGVSRAARPRAAVGVSRRRRGPRPGWRRSRRQVADRATGAGPGGRPRALLRRVRLRRRRPRSGRSLCTIAWILSMSGSPVLIIGGTKDTVATGLLRAFSASSANGVELARRQVGGDQRLAGLGDLLEVRDHGLRG